MKIKTKLYSTAVLSIGLIGVLVLLSFLYSSKVNDELEKAKLADEFAKAISELMILTDQYLAYQEVRVEKRLQLHLNLIKKMVKNAKRVIPLDIINLGFESLNNSFSYLRANYREREELLNKNARQEEIDRTVYLEKRFAALMRSEAQKISAIAFRISSNARQETSTIQQRGNLLFSVFGILLVLTIGSTAIFIAKSITKPIEELVRGTNIISRGNLKHRIDITGRDETGDLSRAFNEMVEQLSQHSENLEELVKERTTKLEEKTLDLEQANIRLKELDQLKSMFIASMSHELRTPLNSIIGFTGIILQGMVGEITEEQWKQLTMVKNSANHLLALINDIIDSSKIEAEKVELAIEEFDLSGLIQEVKDSFNVAATEKGLKISLRMPKRLIIESDRRRIKQVIVNLVSNAVKFSDEGVIGINVAKKDGTVEVSVRDVCTGIRKEDMDKLFRAFSQINIEGRPRQEGTGLGLYLSKKIAELLRGKIEVESELGHGCEFTFALPSEFTGAKT
jgi:signal transduction histidine kinase